jgi:hypothetical protein
MMEKIKSDHNRYLESFGLNETASKRQLNEKISTDLVTVPAPHTQQKCFNKYKNG